MSLNPEVNRHGEIFMASDRLMLVHQMESIGVDGLTIGREGREPAVHVTFAGRINKSTEESDVTVALSPRDALELVNMLLHTLEAFSEGPQASDDARDDGTCPVCRGGSSAEFPCQPCGSTGRLPQGHPPPNTRQGNDRG